MKLFLLVGFLAAPPAFAAEAIVGDPVITLKNSELLAIVDMAVARARAADAEERATAAMKKYRSQIEPETSKLQPAPPAGNSMSSQNPKAGVE